MLIIIWNEDFNQNIYDSDTNIAIVSIGTALDNISLRNDESKIRLLWVEYTKNEKHPKPGVYK